MLHADERPGDRRSRYPCTNAAEAIALIHDGGRCYGAMVRNLVTGELTAYVAKATAIATGGGRAGSTA